MMKLRGYRLVAMIVAAALVLGLFPADRLSAAVPADTPYKLTNNLRVGVKTVLNERTSGGTRIGAVVRLYNGGTRAAVVPNYELRVITGTSNVYTLPASSSNPRYVQPKETIELSYLLTVNRSDTFSLARLRWVNVNEYVYPKEETTVLSVPVSALVWHGHSTAFADEQRLKSWGTSFAIPTVSDNLLFTPVRLWERETAGGVTAVLVLQVTNTGKEQARLPEFTVTGKTLQGYYYGAVRAESGKIDLDPAASTYIHFVMQLPAKPKWKSFTIATPETFLGADGRIDYEAGRIQIRAPQEGPSTQEVQASYRFLSPIRIQSTLQPEVISGIDVSLAELHRFEQSGDGYATAIAKLRLVNRTSAPLPVPEFGASWTTPGGTSYSGERMAAKHERLMPGIGTMLYYVFSVPTDSRNTDRATIMLFDGDGQLLQVPIGAVRTELTPAAADRTAALYPFSLTLNDWAVERMSADKELELTLDIGLERAANVVISDEAIQLKVELAESAGRVIGTRYYPLSGTNRLSSGIQKITMSGRSDLPNSYELRLYEVLSTPAGDIERPLLAVRK